MLDNWGSRAAFLHSEPAHSNRNRFSPLTLVTVQEGCRQKYLAGPAIATMVAPFRRSARIAATCLFGRLGCKRASGHFPGFGPRVEVSRGGNRVEERRPWRRQIRLQRSQGGPLESHRTCA